MRAKNLASKLSIRSEIIYPKDELGPHSRSTEIELTSLNILPKLASYAKNKPKHRTIISQKLITQIKLKLRYETNKNKQCSSNKLVWF